MSYNLLLSICIPTYNRYEKLRPMLLQLLACKREDFEVIVQDNCSNDGTQNIKEDIKDSRLRLIENSKNIGGILNGYGALLNANGKYCMICLDKDCVLGNKLEDFLKTLTETPAISYGLCNLNVKSQNENEIYTSQEERFKFFAYIGRHPSGMFWKSQLLKNCSIIPRILNSNITFGFFTELIFAECSSKEGNGLCYKNPLIITETPEEAAQKKTLTYDISQIFFLPKNRITEYKIYLGHLELLTLNKKIFAWFRVFIRGLKITTMWYKKIMRDTLHLEHYGISPRNITTLEIIGIAVRYVISVLFASRKKAFNGLFLEDF